MSAIPPVGRQIFAARKAAELTAREVGQRTGISSARIASAENGHAVLTAHELTRMGAAMGIAPSRLAAWLTPMLNVEALSEVEGKLLCGALAMLAGDAGDYVTTERLPLSKRALETLGGKLQDVLGAVNAAIKGGEIEAVVAGRSAAKRPGSVTVTALAPFFRGDDAHDRRCAAKAWGAGLHWSLRDERTDGLHVSAWAFLPTGGRVGDALNVYRSGRPTQKCNSALWSEFLRRTLDGGEKPSAAWRAVRGFAVMQKAPFPRCKACRTWLGKLKRELEAAGVSGGGAA